MRRFDRAPIGARRSLMTRIVVALVVLVPLVASCGGPSEEVVRGAPLTAEEEVFFENGVDFVADPEALEGQWRQDWSRELDQRVRRSDIVAYIEVTTLRTDVDLDRRTTYRLFVRQERALLGEVPDDLMLRSKTGDPGYGTLGANEQRLLNGHFVLFLKWELPEGESELVPRWHLSPNVDAVSQRVEYLLERRREVQVRERGRVIVHEHEED